VFVGSWADRFEYGAGEVLHVRCLAVRSAFEISLAWASCARRWSRRYMKLRSLSLRY
jgi:hypothetical protein